MDTATLNPAATAPAATAPVAPLTPKQARRWAARLDEEARRDGSGATVSNVTGTSYAKGATATKLDSLALKADRLEDGFTGREGYVEWTAQRRAALLCALEGATIACDVRHVETYATKRGARARVMLTAVVSVTTVYGTDRVVLRGEGRVTDAPDVGKGALDGLTLSVKLADAGSTSKGEVRNGLKASTVGTASNGVRVGLSATFHVSRHARIVATAL